jgi:hypothetical protein
MLARIRILVAAGFMAPLLAAAAPPTPAAVDALMHNSGTWRQLADIEREFGQGLDQTAAGQATPDAQSAAALRHAFAVAYSPDRLRPAVARELAVALSAEDVETTLAWLATDVGKRITRLEEDESASAHSQERRERAPEVVAGLAPDRLARYQRLAQATHASEVAATMLINMSYGLARGISLAMPGTPTQDPEAIRAALQAGRPRIVAMMEVQQLAYSADTYESLSNEDLDNYIAFAESPVGRRYHAATMIALDRAMTDGATEAGRLLVTGRST